jgi:hypothetical protein
MSVMIDATDPLTSQNKGVRNGHTTGGVYQPYRICSSLHDYHFHEPEEMLACMISGHSGVLNGSLVRWSWSSNFGVYKASENSEDLLDISLLFDLLVVMRMAAVVQMRAALMRWPGVVLLRTM